jgi:hypothetical protein
MFWLPVGILFVAGVLMSEKTQDPGFMNRQQTEEWKGEGLFT